jgi:hypothetical protein
MTTANYMAGRKKYQRPQAMLWADNPGTLSGGLYVPLGNEIGSDTVTDNDFLLLSDHNREPISFKPTRIESRQRMINGRMRSYHIADKLEVSTSWSLLPSRSYALRPDFETDTGDPLQGKSPLIGGNQEYTVDGGAGGAELLDWYENHQGSFWVYLAYDKYPNFGKDDAAYGHLGQYNQIIEMFISDFSYSVERRGGTNHDLWNVSVTLEEV